MQPDAFHVYLYGPFGNAPDSADCETTPIPSSFEAAEERLQQSLPMVLLEPDGSFAWAGKQHRIVGMIYDAAMLIQYIELRGHCTAIHWRKLVETLAGTVEIDDFAVMLLPERQWKNLQSFERMLAGETENPGDGGDI